MSRRKRKKKVNTLVDVVIPVYNRLDILESCLEAIPGAFGKIPYHVYIFDNASEKEEANKFYGKIENDHITVHRNQQNVGFPVACNRAFKKGRSPLVFFLNSDVILHKGSMDFLIKEMDDPETGVVGMKLVFPTHEQLEKTGLSMQIRPAQRLQHIGIVTDVNAQLKHAFINWDVNHPKVNKVRDIMAVTGAALMTRRKLFRSVEMFEEAYTPGTMEDVDLCLKIRKVGYNVRVVPEAVGVHYTGATAETYKHGFPLHRNYQIFMSRWQQELEYWEWRIL